MSPFILGLAGRAGVGKSTTARALAAARADVRLESTSGALKAMLAGFYRHQGLDDFEIERRIEGDLKRTPDPLLCGRTPTYAMQTLGTEWGRDLIGVSLWVDAWRRRAAALFGAGSSVVNDSIRFADEAAAIAALGGKVARLVHPTRRHNVSDHVSERPAPCDVEIPAIGAPDAVAEHIANLIESER